MNKVAYIFSCCLLLIFLASSCKKNESFKVSGMIQGAEGKQIYLEQMALSGNVVIDSAIVKHDASFKFKAKRPEYPDIYRMILEGKQFVFSVDSCEHIQIYTSLEDFSYPDSISGSDKVKQMQVLRKSVANLQADYLKAVQNELSVDEFRMNIEKHKEMARKIILQNPRSIVAYYALFQKVGGYFLFSPYEKEDRAFCAAVATAFHTFMPEYQRSKNLYALVLGAIQAERAEKNAYDIQKMVDNAEVGFLDIQLPDVNGQTQTLSSLKGNVFLLDFSAAEMPNNTAYIFELRDLYNRYHEKGFQIYQVSADRSLLLWQDAVKALPWICVRGEQGSGEECFRLYNISQIPTNFLFGKDGVIVAKNIPFEDMPSHIEKQLGINR
ncbi:MAG: AhpC/TSA family protein [Bacteroidetes bacterium]|uniref:AhpC/TSA family protein n=1 Tax=Candidatus Gallipaludibacter merdavium TaxID=2840839 RepID=A0A9D9HRW7_9BACT|nr:AhpC/TSA family protein [Candidatus Gallipaludibacter merdavium]